MCFQVIKIIPTLFFFFLDCTQRSLFDLTHGAVDSQVAEVEPTVMWCGTRPSYTEAPINTVAEVLLLLLLLLGAPLEEVVIPVRRH